MDPKTTGAFIASLRKEKNMTQKQLAEKLNVSDKAVSRWETGRGYPDVEFLQALSNEFSVSINELLYGKRIETPAMAQTAEKHMAGAYIKTHHKGKRACIAAILALALVLSVLAFGCLYTQIMGSPNCVIASDYSYMTLLGQRYVPLPLEGAECVISERLIGEVRLEDMPFIGKLLFGESVYSVKQCASNEIVYLQTDYDLLESRFFCLESKVEEYKQILREIPFDRLTAQIPTGEGDLYDRILEDSLAQMLTNADYTVDPGVDCSWSRGEGDESVPVYSLQTKGVFRRAEGELLCKQGQYYWFDYDDIPEDQNNSDFSKISAYQIDDRYDEALNALFSYMYK